LSALRPSTSDRTSIRIQVALPPEGSFARHREPVRLGVPLAVGACVDASHATLLAPSGQEHALQARALDWWPDRSIRWLLIDFQADHDGSSTPVEYQLQCGPARAVERTAQPDVAVVREQDALIVDTGAARFRLRSQGRFPFERVMVAGEPAIDPARTGLRLETSAAQPCEIYATRIELEESGPVRAVVRVEGSIGPSLDRPLVQLIATLHFFSGSGAIRVGLTLRNPRRAEHRGGFWELGDSGSVFIRDAEFHIALPPESGSVDVQCSPELSAPLGRYSSGLELFQASSGGDHWNGTNHVNREGIVPLAFRGYRLQSDGTHRTGVRATPVMALRRRSRQMALTLPEFWQRFPKAMEAADDSLTVRLFPRQYGDVHELQGGEQQTSVLWLAFGADTITEIPLDWTRQPLLVRAMPDQYCSSSAIPYLIAESEDSDPTYRQLVHLAVDGTDSFAQKRERIDEYGWRNYGDLYADHEASFNAGTAPLVSHYNNQYDGIAGFAYQFMMTGDWRWWQLCASLASHVTDIDIYHCDRDKAAYNNGLFWHTAHYTDAGKSTHRSFPRAEKVGGGGPSCEHNYSTGLMLHYFLTGESSSRDAAIALAHWVVDMDDGDKTVFRVLARGNTGLASATAFPDYHGPGRGAGNSINVLLNGHRLTNHRVFLDKAEALIRRTVHPSDDIAGRDLLNPEPRWSYTVFLCALGKYLDHKIERHEIDSMYAYARESLLAYTTWMSDHERPYLDHPDILEFPNETWAAQELWKTDAFLFAAKHATGEARARFLERAQFFFRYAIDTLKGAPTRSLARPMVLLLSHGHAMGYFERHAEAESAPASPTNVDFGQPGTPFVSQKHRAIKRFRALAVAGTALMVLLLALFLLRGC
jgi:PcRGLX-like N-terminal RIFT barrel domain